MSARSFRALSSLPKQGLLLSALLAGGMCASAVTFAQTAPQNVRSANPASASNGAPTPSKDRSVAKPGDRTCLQQTGSLIPPRNGNCLPVAGRSYGSDELRNTGAIDNAHALQMLDPSISRGH